MSEQPATPAEEPQEPEAPQEAEEKGAFETDTEGVYSATKGGVPDPTVQPGGGTTTDPMPDAPEATTPEK